MVSSGTCSWSGETTLDINEQEYMVEFEATADWWHDSGYMYRSNGDPGDPPDDDFEIKRLYITAYKVDSEGMAHLIPGVPENEELLDLIYDATTDYLYDNQDKFTEDDPPYPEDDGDCL